MGRGYINITADSLSVTNGAVITTSTLGRGDAGNVFINARDIVFDGMGRFNGEFRRSSGATSAVRDIGVGQGGSINVTAESLRISNGASLITSTFGQGNAGNVFINARNIVLDGVGSYLDEVQSYSFPSGVSSQVETGAVGQGGYVNVTADSLSVTNGAELATSSQGNNNAAGLQQAGGDGGNITISAPNGFIVAVPDENSDITANAFSGSGGRVKINATDIFGIAPLSRQELERLRPEDLNPLQLPTNDITAISQTNPSLSGIVEINTPDVDPSRGLVNLPTVPIDTEVVQACTPGGQQGRSEFIITSRGGLPPNPGDALSTDAVQVDLVTLNSEVAQPSTPAVSTSPTSPKPARIV